MAAIQPKNTTDIRADNLDEKTSLAGLIIQGIVKFVKSTTATTCWTFTQSDGSLASHATNGGDIQFNKAGKGVQHTVAATFTTAGTTQGTATAIASQATVITTCVAGVTDGAQLPTPVIGKPYWVANESGASAKIYGTTGVNIDDGAANASFTLADNTHKMFMPITATRWLSF